MTIVSDGTGKSYRAKVDEYNKLRVRSVSQGIAAWKARNGDSFFISSPKFAVTDTEGLMIWLMYPDEHLVIDRLSIGWNGGSTNHNRAMEFGLQIEGTTPSGNNDPRPIGNLRSDSQKTLYTATAYTWDGTGTGMTGSSGGDRAMDIVVAQGDTTWDIAGKLIIGPTHSIGIYARGEEAGVFTCIMCFLPVTEDELRLEE